MACKAAVHYKIKGITHLKQLKRGYKKCTVCEIVLDTDEMRCTCCGWKLKTTPRNGSKAGRERYNIKSGKYRY